MFIVYLPGCSAEVFQRKGVLQRLASSQSLNLSPLLRRIRVANASASSKSHVGCTIAVTRSTLILLCMGPACWFGCQVHQLRGAPRDFLAKRLRCNKYHEAVEILFVAVPERITASTAQFLRVATRLRGLALKRCVYGRRDRRDRHA
jgi:hypothetical protein